MSYLHFTSTEKYRNRVIQLGEQPNRVFDVGAIGLDNIKSLSLLSKEELSESLDFVLDSPYLLITFHPVTLESNTSEQQFKILLDTLDQYKDLKIIFTLPNADADGRIIIKLVEAYVKENNDRVRSFTSLGQLRFLSALKYASAVVGNSSSGIIEAPSFKIPTINIGDRQKGRIQAATVINAEPNPTSITSAMDEALSSTFKQMCSTTTNPYGEGDTAERIMKILKSHSTIKSLKKKFFDLAV